LLGQRPLGQHGANWRLSVSHKMHKLPRIAREASPLWQLLSLK